MSSSLSVQLLVIGWGKAGKTLAKRYAAAGRSVAMVERSQDMYGGTCINVACVPTRTSSSRQSSAAPRTTPRSTSPPRSPSATP